MYDQNTIYKHAQMTSNTSDIEMKINTDIIEDNDIINLCKSAQTVPLYNINKGSGISCRDLGSS